MKSLFASISACVLALATPAFADYEKVTTKADFVALVAGQISGMGAVWEITGQWQWKGNYLCRSLEWGGDDLGYNCQSVEADGAKMRITSDKGAGQSAEFRLR